MFQSLLDKKVVIIGASSGIDLAIASKTAEMGASIVISCCAYNLHFFGSATIGNSVMLWKITDTTAYQVPHKTN